MTRFNVILILLLLGLSFVNAQDEKKATVPANRNRELTPPDQLNFTRNDYCIDCSQMIGVAQNAFPSYLVNMMLCIAHYESSYCPTAYNYYSGASGLWQIEPYYWTGVGACPDNSYDFFNANDNAACANTVVEQQGLTAWSTYDYGDCDAGYYYGCSE
eukprot:TRINITY_DN13243_c0_g1_i1.p1 TRINITY_DN13243_c0_g1~~TRINITY_DN13243_c0_g1_i1.p1  ORF type:complete len:158 (-),score=3.53 TRINITY_DN13243_c0_g1_i1:175-648(-)